MPREPSRQKTGRSEPSGSGTQQTSSASHCCLLTVPAGLLPGRPLIAPTFQVPVGCCTACTTQFELHGPACLQTRGFTPPLRAQGSHPPCIGAPPAQPQPGWQQPHSCPTCHMVVRVPTGRTAVDRMA